MATRPRHSAPGSDHLPGEIANRIHGDLSSFNGPFLPASRHLAEHHGVSQKTLLQALGILEEAHVVSRRRGRRTRIAAYANSSAPRLQSGASFDRALNHLRSLITDCVVRAGEALPKVASIMAETGGANRTVLKAYHQLCAEGLAYQAGRRWVAGKPRDRSPMGSSGSPVMIVFLWTPVQWQDLAQAERTAQFCTAFQREARRNNVQLRVVLPQSGHTAGHAIPCGEEDIEQLIRSLGKRYVGSVVLGGTPSFYKRSDLTEAKWLGQWLTFLSQFGKPLCWVDYRDEGRSELAALPAVVRCHFGERQGVRCALHSIASSGHRSIVLILPLPEGSDPWRDRRIALIREEARAMGITCCVEAPPEAPLDTLGGPGGGAVLADLALRAPAAVEELVASLAAPDSQGSDMRALATPTGYGRFHEYVRSIAPRRRRGRGLARDAAVVAARITHLDRDGSLEGPNAKYSPWRTLRNWIQFSAQVGRVVIRLRDSTCLLCLCDSDADTLCQILISSGIRIPADMSILSFDNYSLLFTMPVSTVDFGFGHLGYAAFHAVLKDIPIRSNRAGDVASRAHIVDRGSIGKVHRGDGMPKHDGAGENQ